MKSLLYDIRQQRLDINIKPGVFYNGIDDYSIKVSSKNKKNGMMYNVMIYDHTQHRGNVDVTVSDSAIMKITPDKQFMLINLYNGRKYTYLPEQNRHRAYRTYPSEIQMFDDEMITMKLNGFGLKRTAEDLFKENYQMMNVSQLRYYSDSLSKVLKKNEYLFSNSLQQNNYFRKLPPKDTLKKIPLNLAVNVDSLFNAQPKNMRLKIIKAAINYARSTNSYITSSSEDFKWRAKLISKFDIEFYKKYSVPVACFILFFIGAPLGAIIRKGGLGWPVVISVFFFMLYYVISMIAEKSVKEGVMPAFEGVWLSSFVLLPIGIFLTYKSNNDSVMFNITTYIEPIKKILKKLKIIKKQTK
jgi:lipopolysaccharide export system permease protein